jgi:hypothetical protein
MQLPFAPVIPCPCKRRIFLGKFLPALATCTASLTLGAPTAGFNQLDSPLLSQFKFFVGTALFVVAAAAPARVTVANVPATKISFRALEPVSVLTY